MYQLASFSTWALSFIVLRTVESQTDILERCCYGDKSVPHGSVVFSHPERCFQLVCQNGRIRPVYVNRKGDKYCCELNGRLIPNGVELRGNCMVMLCEAGIWEPADKIEDCCSHCSLYNDPHIRTLDGTRYDWHGRCNYSVAQTYYTTKPDIGVFSQFKSCNGIASCLTHTTYRNDPNTIITLDNGDVSRVKVNGYENEIESVVNQLTSEDGTVPVLAWKHENCIFLMGSSKLLILHCPHRLDIWAHKFHTERLNGLCGHFNGLPEDDFTDRDGSIHPISYWPMTFPHSWLTSEQSARVCNLNLECPGCLEENTTDPCEASQSRRDFFDALCREPLRHLEKTKDFEQYMETCAFDLCAIYQYGGTDTDAREWVREVGRLVEVVKDF
ncbi:mucin-2-like [Palaemon carinicauda]|uniref:mucin-2-like n=1 Tax=Palaemon carinicauda TaxID=392227 RepID=UPI0035B59CD1